jgi:RimJ/RimL family protein N-acetyltransferase
VPDRNAYNAAHALTLSHAEFKNKVREHRLLMGQDVCHILGAFHDDGRLVGQIELVVLARLDLQVGHVGYHIHEPYRGQGFGKTALTLGLKAGHEDLLLQRIEAFILPGNEASMRLAARVGMLFESIRQCSSWHDGEWRDHKVFVSLREGRHAPSIRETLRRAIR